MNNTTSPHNSFTFLHGDKTISLENGVNLTVPFCRYKFKTVHKQWTSKNKKIKDAPQLLGKLINTEIPNFFFNSFNSNYLKSNLN